MKKCSKCKEYKPIIAFSPDKGKKSGLKSECKPCRVKPADLSKYGITKEEYDIKLANQGNCCAICKRNRTEFRKALAVDHDHVTGKVRELLCDSCNLALGLIKENSQTAAAMAAYIERNKKAAL